MSTLTHMADRNAANDNQGRQAPIEPPHTMDLGVRMEGCRGVSMISDPFGPRPLAIPNLSAN